MSEIKVTFGGLEAASASITSNAQKVQGSLDDLKSYLQPLVATWTGEASEAYQNHQRQWDTAAADLQQVLAAIGTAVQRAADDYRDGERNNAGRW
ncbi:WXG100 family type VII secretion target [Actinophytocola gossypii]|uniref:ESAT-6-like protein n=1 Tax=Actinophytocola gossypii TaxID=2812003 RepID=A0ABT2JIQ2_9PSEU|nr:WXG100 family type VII secretion target [Actinophytocola gossypii]MCT2587404.1 WXG100 family type VII secretion target [Actinophytocola gossypii]